MAAQAQPWMKFYPQDWRADERLRMCSLAARGLWMELLAIMHRSERYGQLLIAGRVPTEDQLAVQVGACASEVAALLAELDAAGVFSRAAGGAIYSRRMIRDQKKAEIARKNGRKGGNPSLATSSRKQTIIEALVNPEDIRTDKGGDKAQIPEARGHIIPLPPVQPNVSGEEQARKQYVFAGKTIRLNNRDFDQWAASYHAISDLRAELQSLDDWLQSPNVPDAKRTSWFTTVSGILGRKHNKWLAEAEAAAAVEQAFNRRHPKRAYTEQEAQALMTNTEFGRWKDAQGTKGCKIASSAVG